MFARLASSSAINPPSLCPITMRRPRSARCCNQPSQGGRILHEGVQYEIFLAQAGHGAAANAALIVAQGCNTAFGQRLGELAQFTGPSQTLVAVAVGRPEPAISSTTGGCSTRAG